MDKNDFLNFVNKKLIKGTLMETLSIEFTEVGEDFVTAIMPVNSKVHQPMGLLHGGATVALAESVGSAATHLFIDNELFEAKGLEITANHIRSVKDGFVTATAKPIHKGRTTHLWEVRIIDNDANLISICKLTMIVLPKRK